MKTAFNLVVVCECDVFIAVSYTHLDVYKRQAQPPYSPDLVPSNAKIATEKNISDGQRVIGDAIKQLIAIPKEICKLFENWKRRCDKCVKFQTHCKGD